MGNSSFKLSIHIGFLVIIALVAGIAGQIAIPVEKVNVIISFATSPAAGEELIRDIGGTVSQSFHVIPGVAAAIPRNKLVALGRDPRIASIDEDIPVQASGRVAYGEFGKANSVVLTTARGNGVKVAVLDTGIDLDHPDLKVAGNVSFVDGTANGDDDNGHGTIVAGIIGALDNGTGVVGVAPEAELYSVKVMNKNGDVLMRWMLSGIQWSIDNRMQVINMSFGSAMNMPDAIVAALDNACKAGIVIVAGAGNSGTPSGDGDNVCTPARYAPVIAVGSIDSNNNRYATSSTGYKLELMAPGVNINSTAMGGGYGTITGTSASAPYVAGVAAVIISSGITNNTEVRKRMRSSALDLGEAGWDTRYGSGYVDTKAALSFAEPPDKTAPVTQILLNGKTGRNGWYLSDVTVTLSAGENPGGSGVARTEYSLDNGKTWNTYALPLTIATESRYIPILARSIDNAGNTEGPAVSVTLKIDKTAPVVTETLNITQVYGEIKKGTLVEIEFKATAQDDGSGVDGPVSTTLIDEYGTQSQSLGAFFQGKALVEAWCKAADKDGRTFTFKFTIYDAAGNSASAEAVTTILPRSADTETKQVKQDVEDKENKNKANTNNKR